MHANAKEMNKNTKLLIGPDYNTTRMTLRKLRSLKFDSNYLCQRPFKILSVRLSLIKKYFEYFYFLT